MPPGQQIAGRGQATSRRPVVTIAGPGPEPHPLRPTSNSSPLPATRSGCRRRRGSSRRPERRARATRKADSGTQLACPGRQSGTRGATQLSGAAPLESPAIQRRAERHSHVRVPLSGGGRRSRNISCICTPVLLKYSSCSEINGRGRI